MDNSSPFVDFSRLYRMQDESHTGAFQVQLDVTFERAYALFLGHEAKDPLHARWHMGRSKPKDAIGNSYLASLLVSEKVKKILESNHFTGFRTLQCEVRDKKGDLMLGYYFLQVTGRCGPIDESRRVMTQAKYPMGMFPVLRGAYFDEKSWDQSDLFSAPNYNMVMVTESVKKALEAGKASGFHFTPLNLIDRIPLPPTASPRRSS